VKGRGKVLLPVTVLVVMLICPLWLSGLDRLVDYGVGGFAVGCDVMLLRVDRRGEVAEIRIDKYRANGKKEDGGAPVEVVSIINGRRIRLGDDAASVVSALGRPERTWSYRESQGLAFSDFGEVDLRYGTVSAIRVVRDGWETSTGIRVGKPWQDCKELLGLPHTEHPRRSRRLFGKSLWAYRGLFRVMLFFFAALVVRGIWRYVAIPAAAVGGSLLGTFVFSCLFSYVVFPLFGPGGPSFGDLFRITPEGALRETSSLLTALGLLAVAGSEDGVTSMWRLGWGIVLSICVGASVVSELLAVAVGLVPLASHWRTVEAAVDGGVEGAFAFVGLLCCHRIVLSVRRDWRKRDGVA